MIYLGEYSYLIGIPSRSRTHLIEKHMGIHKLIDTERHNAKLFVRHVEASSYRAITKIPVVPVPDSYKICDKRQAMFDYCMDEGIEYLFIIDDDVVLYHRDESLPSKYKCELEAILANDSFTKLLKESMTLCGKEFPAVGIPLKQGSQGKNTSFEVNSPIIRFVCYHVPTLQEADIQIDGLKTMFMSDRYVQLSLMEKGYKTLSNCRYAIDDRGTGKPGGCQDTRTVELQSEAARKLQATFPECVELKVKEGEGTWKEQRLDCTINWRWFTDNIFVKLTLKEMEEQYGITI